MCIEYLDHLPPIPEELLDTLDDILTVLPQGYMSPTVPTDSPVFQTRIVNKKLRTWLKEIFPFEIRKIQYQIVGEMDFAAHIDYGRTTAYNYLLDPGGPNVRISMYKNPDNGLRFFPNANQTLELLESEILQPYRWHRLDVSLPHMVSGIIPGKKRIAVSVDPVTDDWIRGSWYKKVQNEPF